PPLDEGTATNLAFQSVLQLPIPGTFRLNATCNNRALMKTNRQRRLERYQERCSPNENVVLTHLLFVRSSLRGHLSSWESRPMESLQKQRAWIAESHFP